MTMGADNQAARVMGGQLAKALRRALNEHGGQYLLDCLQAFETAVRARDRSKTGTNE